MEDSEATDQQRAFQVEERFQHEQRQEESESHFGHVYNELPPREDEKYV